MRSKSILVMVIVVFVTRNLQADLSQGLVGYWNFDEGSSSTIAHEYSGSNYDHGSIYGATWVDGISGKALSFDGIDDYVDIADSPDLNPSAAISVAAWIKPDSGILSVSFPAIVKKVGPSRGYALEFLSGSDIKFYTHIQGITGATEDVTLTIGNWHFVVGIYDGSEMVLYVDGIPTLPYYISGDIDIASSHIMHIGHDPWHDPSLPYRFYSGVIDEVRIYNRALSQSEVTELYNNPPPPIADAGPDQIVMDADDNGSEEITLDGSGSSYSGGTIVSWIWTDDLGDTIPDGEITTATLSVGTHTITLVVIDDDGLTDTDTVTITVELWPGEPPVADAGDDIIADANEEVILDASASFDPDGDIVQYTWTVLPEEEVFYLGPDSSFTTKALGRVEEVIKLTVTDDRGGTAEDTVSIFNRKVEDIELIPGPQGPQGEQGLQGEEGPAGITPTEIAQIQAQITALQQANAALLLQIQALEQQNALLQQAINDNRYLLEQLPQLRKQLEELMSTVQEETP